MAKKNKFFNRFNKQKYHWELLKKYPKSAANDLSFSDDIRPNLIEEYQKKAIKFIKVKQFHAGFPEIFSHAVRGKIEVSITQDPEQKDLFEVNFQFVILPAGITLFREQKTITFTKLRQFAVNYDEDQKHIDEELSKREEALHQGRT